MTPIHPLLLLLLLIHSLGATAQEAGPDDPAVVVPDVPAVVLPDVPADVFPDVPVQLPTESGPDCSADTSGITHQCPSSGECIYPNWVCDGDPDCGDGSDEEGCECTSYQYTCTSTGRCIHIYKRCDGVSDCPGNDDEEGCTPRAPRPTTTRRPTTRNPTCGERGDLDVTESPQQLTSPGYPSSYPNGLNCFWTLTAPAGEVIELEFSSFQTESCCDIVTITDFGTGTVLGTYQGSNLSPAVIVSSTNSVSIRFRTDGSVTGEGYELEYWVASGNSSRTPRPPPTRRPTPRNPTCGDAASNLNVTESPQQLTSPGYPSSYPNSANCYWVLTAPAGQVIELEFISFATESCCDSVTITDVGTGTILGTYQGSNLSPGIITSRSNSVSILFRTDGSVVYPGYELEYWVASANSSRNGPGTPGPSGGSCPPDFVQLTSRRARTSQCYKVLLTSNSWYESTEICSHLAPGAHLAVIDSQAENDVIKNYLSSLPSNYLSYCSVFIPTDPSVRHNPSFYIGAQREELSDCDSPFVWATGDYLSPGFTDWTHGEPSCYRVMGMATESCATISIGFSWNDIPCELRTCSLCQASPA